MAKIDVPGGHMVGVIAPEKPKTKESESAKSAPTKPTNRGK